MQVFYFSRTGNCEKIATTIAKSNGIDANKIDDGVDWSGKASFFKAGAMAAKKEILEVKHAEIDATGDIILVFPIWAGSFPPAVRGFLNGVDTEKVTLVSVSAISLLKDEEKQKFKAVYETKGKVLQAPSELLKQQG